MLDTLTKTKLKSVLHLGCGGSYIDVMPKGFRDNFTEKRLDINPDVNPDYLMSVTDLSAIPPMEFDALYSSHMVEHIYAHQIVEVMQGFKRILKPNGFAVITCPDIMVIAEQIVRGEILKPTYKCVAGFIYPADVLFGHQESIKKGNDFMAHKHGFTKDSLGAYLFEAGFGTVYVKRRPQFLDLWAVAFPKQQSNSYVEAIVKDYVFGEDSFRD